MRNVRLITIYFISAFGIIFVDLILNRHISEYLDGIIVSMLGFTYMYKLIDKYLK